MVHASLVLIPMDTAASVLQASQELNVTRVGNGSHCDKQYYKTNNSIDLIHDNLHRDFQIVMRISHVLCLAEHTGKSKILK